MAEYFTITRTLRAPRELVFEALTKPEHFAVWFGTAAVEVPQDTPHDGRAPRRRPSAPSCSCPTATASTGRARTSRSIRPSHLAMTLTDQPGDDTGLPVLFDLEEVDGGTQLTIRQDRSDFSDEQVEATIAGYNAFIDDIERVLEGLQTA